MRMFVGMRRRMNLRVRTAAFQRRFRRFFMMTSLAHGSTSERLVLCGECPSVPGGLLCPLMRGLGAWSVLPRSTLRSSRAWRKSTETHLRRQIAPARSRQGAAIAPWPRRGAVVVCGSGTRGKDCSGAFVVDALGVVERHCPDRAGRGDAPPVTVRGDRPECGRPRRGTPLVQGRHPRLTVLEVLLRERVEALLHELLPLYEGLPHVRIGDAGGARDQARDQASGAPLRGRIDRRDLLQPVPEQRAEVAGIVDAATADDAREEVVDVVPVGFEPAQLRGEDPEGVCLDELVDRLRREASGLQEGHPAFLPRDLRDGVVLRGELLERAPEVLLHGDRVVRGELRTGMLQDPVEDAPGGVLQILAVLMLLEVMLIGGD